MRLFEVTAPLIILSFKAADGDDAAQRAAAGAAVEIQLLILRDLCNTTCAY